MIVYSMAQSAVEYVALTMSEFAQRVLGFAEEAVAFAVDNPILLVILVVVAVVYFALTKPGTH